MIDNMVTMVEAHSWDRSTRSSTPHFPTSQELRSHVWARHRKTSWWFSRRWIETVQKDRNREDVRQARREYRWWIARPELTLILAVCNSRGMIYHDFFQGGTNAERFNAWLRAASGAAGNCDATFVFDKAPCHRRYQQAQLPDNHRCKYLPAYSPFLNIAKNCFSVWKAAFKRQMAEICPQLQEQLAAQRNATLMQIGAQNLDTITAENCMHCVVSKDHNVHTGYDSTAGDCGSPVNSIVAFDLHMSHLKESSLFWNQYLSLLKSVFLVLRFMFVYEVSISLNETHYVTKSFLCLSWNSVSLLISVCHCTFVNCP